MANPLWEDVEAQVHNPVDLEKLIKRIDFSEELVIIAALEQPKLYLKCIRTRTLAARYKAEAEAKFELVKSELSLKIRKGEKVKTEGHIKELLNQHESYRSARKKLDRGRESEEFLDKLCRVFEMRMQVIKVVSDSMSAEKVVHSRKLAQRAAEVEKEHLRRKWKHRH